MTSYRKQRGASYTPFAFTEQGVAMLSSVLRSEKAILINIAIMRTFVEFRRYALSYTGKIARASDLKKIQKMCS